VAESRRKILLSVTLDEVKRRIALGGTDGDPFDNMDDDYFKRVINGYEQMAVGNWGGVRWYSVDGMQTRWAVAREIRGLLDIEFGLNKV